MSINTIIIKCFIYAYQSVIIQLFSNSTKERIPLSNFLNKKLGNNRIVVIFGASLIKT
jgi:hypothetical protein